MPCNCKGRGINILRGARAATRLDFAAVKREAQSFARSSVQDVRQLLRIPVQSRVNLQARHIKR